jgi:hypothetical protein
VEQVDIPARPVSLFFLSFLDAAVGCRTDIEVSDWQVENLLHGR